MRKGGMRFSPMPRDHPLSDRLTLTDVPELSDLLLRAGKVRLRIASRSMAPTLQPGDEIAVEPVSIDALRGGDLVLFEHQGALICHRLVEVSGTPPTLLTRGDAQGCGGERIDQHQVVGKVVAVQRRTLWVGLKDTLQRTLLPFLLRWLPHLQGLRAYRLLLRPFIVPFLTYQLGLAQGSRWYQWQELRTANGLPTLPPSSRHHLLVAKLRRNMAGRAYLTRTDAGWQCTQVDVRIRYRGLGIESDLTRVAHLLCKTKATQP